MKSPAKIVGIIILCVITAGLAFIGFIYLSNRTLDQTVATDLEISTEWREIRLDRALSVSREIQNMNLTIDGFRDPPPGLPYTIKLPDETVIKPEIEIYDEGRSRHVLMHSGFVTKLTTDIVFKPVVDLPKDHTYPKVRIRSDVPFVLKRMYWRNSNLK